MIEEVTKSTGGREGLEGKSLVDGGVGRGAEGLEQRGSGVAGEKDS